MTVIVVNGHPRAKRCVYCGAPTRRNGTPATCGKHAGLPHLDARYWGIG